MKYAIGAAWLLLAVVFRNPGGGRRFFAYAGAIVALMHVLSMAGGWLNHALRRPTSEVTVDLVGVFAGILAGIVLGALLGGTVYRNHFLYWIMQVVAAGFLAFYPLFP